MKWSRDALDFEVPINAAIWSESSELQRTLQPPKAGSTGDIGGMQGLVGSKPLPWVPDLVGRSWREPGSVMVFGASYADFFSAFSGRATRMSRAYRASTPWASFQEEFLHSVVDNDPHYYDPVQRLLQDAAVGADRVVLTDHCRASFVEIQGDTASASETVLRDNDQLFARYVDANAAWHRERLRRFGGNVVVALGALATRGVLHLLHGGTGCRWVRTGPAPSCSKVRWEGGELHVLRVPHPAAYGQSPRDGAPQLRALLAGESVPLTRQRPRPAAPTSPSHTSTEALWRLALRPATSLAAARLMAEHPDAAQKTKRLFEDGCTARRVVAITNAMFNPCRPANLRKQGLPVTAEQAWMTLFERRDSPQSNRRSKWRQLVAALDPMPPGVEARIRRMSITELGSLAASMVNGPYPMMESV